MYGIRAVCALLCLGVPAFGKSLRVLFVGNSYTYVNDLPTTIANIAAAAGHEVIHTSHTPGGGTLGSTPSQELIDALNNRWDYVVLQDQSEIGGVPPGYTPHTQTVMSEFKLQYFFQPAIYKAGAKALLYMTWGREKGDPHFPMFSDYPTMQLDLIQSYHRYLQYLRFDENGTSLQNGTYEAHISPCGVAWQTVYQDIEAKSQDPLAAGSLFNRLYGGDAGGHPSALGQYLNGMVFFTRLFKENPENNTYTQGSASEEEFAYLRRTAASVALEYDQDEQCFPSLSCALYGTCSDIGACQCYKTNPPDSQPCGMGCDDMCDPSPPPEGSTFMAALRSASPMGMNKNRTDANMKLNQRYAKLRK